MSTEQSSLTPRKRPVQARSGHTVDAIFGACIEVLLAHGVDGLTTTRVAERAGVSVGTLYQYYANKQSLLGALLEAHLSQVVSAVEEECARAGGQPLEAIVNAVVDAYVRARMARPQVAKALLPVAAEPVAQALVGRMAQRLQLALGDALAGAADARFADASLASLMLHGALAGPVQAVLAADMPPVLVDQVRAQMTVLALAYLRAIAAPQDDRPG